MADETNDDLPALTDGDHWIAQLTTERDEAQRERDYLRELHTALQADYATMQAEVANTVRTLREQVAFWELSSRPRLLGIAPDQLELVRALLNAVDDDARHGALDRSTALFEEWRRWRDAGRPLGGAP